MHNQLPIPDHLAHLIQTQTSWDTIPSPKDILVNGGLPGVEYAFVLGENIGFYTDPGLGEDGWQLVRGAGVLRVGPANNVMLICRGTPIMGADPTSGARQWYIDPDLEAMLPAPVSVQPAAEV